MITLRLSVICNYGVNIAYIYTRKAKMLLKSIIASALTCLAIISFEARASFIGDEVSVSWTSDTSGVIYIVPTRQFVSPQIVGGGVDFSGAFQLENMGPSMDIFIDVMPQGFSISFGSAETIVDFGLRPFRIELDGLDWIGEPSSIVGMSLAIVGTPNHFTSVQNFGFGPNSAFVNLEGGSIHETLAFSFDMAPVPIPAAVWLFGSGLIGLIGIARR